MKDKILNKLQEIGYKPATDINELISNRMILIEVVDEILNSDTEEENIDE